MRIFLSYGHDRNAPLVERIARDLRAAGHGVWIDAAEIKSGRRLAPSASSTDSEGVGLDPGIPVALFRRATRASASTSWRSRCMPKAGTIATILLEAESEVRPPVSVSHIQWLDMHDWLKLREAEGGSRLGGMVLHEAR